MNESITVRVGVPTPFLVCPHASACITSVIILKVMGPAP